MTRVHLVMIQVSLLVRAIVVPRIRRSIIQIQIERPCIRAIIPIPAHIRDLLA